MVKIILDYDSFIINCKTKFGKSGIDLTNNNSIINLIKKYNNEKKENYFIENCKFTNKIHIKKMQ